MENAFPLASKFADEIIIVSETKLTCINKKLIGDTRVIHIVNCSCKNCSEDFQISEDGLGRKKGICQQSPSVLPLNSLGG